MDRGISHATYEILCDEDHKKNNEKQGQMRILVLNHEYPPIGGGGGQACKDIVDELARRGYEITVLTAGMDDLIGEESSSNIKIIRLSSLRKLPYRVGIIGMAAYTLKASLAGWKIIRQWKPQLIHVHFAVPAGVAAFLLSILTGTPYIITSHLGDVPDGVPEKTSAWFRWIFPFTIPIWKKASKIVAVSEFTASLARRHYNVQAEIIHNGMTPNSSDFQIKVNDPPVIIFAGRFMPQKNLFTFVEIINSVRDLKWKCVMLGDGPLFQEIFNQLNDLDLLDRISLPGWVSPDVVKEKMAQCDILLMPSLSEGLSVVGVQALTAGLAIIANNVGGFSDLVESNKNGFLAELSDVQALKKVLRDYLLSPEMLFRARCNSLKVAHKFDITHIVDKYEVIFSQTAIR